MNVMNQIHRKMKDKGWLAAFRVHTDQAIPWTFAGKTAAPIHQQCTSKLLVHFIHLMLLEAIPCCDQVNLVAFNLASWGLYLSRRNLFCKSLQEWKMMNQDVAMNISLIENHLHKNLHMPLGPIQFFIWTGKGETCHELAQSTGNPQIPWKVTWKLCNIYYQNQQFTTIEICSFHITFA
jgi:hypothetical protein